MDKNSYRNVETINYLRWVAIILMVIDHAGLWLLDNNPVLRTLGQAAYPIFGWLIVVGYENTRNVELYLYRLLILALLSQAPYVLLGMDHMNPIFGLVTGLIIIMAVNERSIYGIILFGSYLILGIDIYQMIVIVIMYVWRHEQEKMIAILMILFVMRGILINMVAIGAGISMILITIPGRIRYMIDRLYYYLIYPVHLVVIYMIRWVMI